MFHFRVKMSQFEVSQAASPEPSQKKSRSHFLCGTHTLKKPLFCNLQLRHQVAYLNQLVCRACFISNMERSDYYYNLADQSFSQDDRWDLNPIHYINRFNFLCSNVQTNTIKHFPEEIIYECSVCVSRSLKVCSHYHDARHDWNRGLNHGLIVVILSDLIRSWGQSWQSC